MKKYLEFIWAVLALLTLFAYLLGYLKIITSSFVAILLFTTFVKGALVIDYFMGLKEVALKYRMIPFVWLSLVIVLIGVAYYMPITSTQ
jgi:cytochrome c oxidase subunit IV